MTSPELRRVAAGDVELAVFDWQPAGVPEDPSPILLAHATGFHARCWDQVVARLGRRRVLAVDLRGHGRSGKRLPDEGWETYGRDLARVVEALDLAAVVGVGHSMGGHAMVGAATEVDGRFARLLLIDPVILSPEEYALGGGARGTPPGFEHPTARRRDRWSSPEEMIARFRERTPYAAFAPAVLEDYCRHGLLPTAEGDFALACPPAFEAQVYMSARSHGNVYAQVGRIDAPVLVVRAMMPPPDRGAMDFRYSPTWPGLAAEFPRGRDLHLADRTHFFPMEDPELAARLILGADGAGAS